DAWLRARRVSAPQAVAAHLVTLGLVGVSDTVVRRGIVAALGLKSMVPWSATLLYYADWTVVGYLVVVVVARAVAAHDAFVARERQTLALEAQLARARLWALEEQLHPHFLFNSLGAVTELAHE